MRKYPLVHQILTNITYVADPYIDMRYVVVRHFNHVRNPMSREPSKYCQGEEAR
jgi:hypothetical protein